MDDTLVKEEMVETVEDSQGDMHDSSVDYGALGGGDTSTDEHGNKYNQQIDSKHPQPLPEAVVEALAGPSGMQGVCQFYYMYSIRTRKMHVQL